MPLSFVEALRGKTVALLMPVFKCGSCLHPNYPLNGERLESENHFLRLEINKLRALLEQKAQVELLDQELKHYALVPRRYEEMKFLANVSHQAVPARVIYRDPSSWSSSVWIDVGQQTNAILGRAVIQKNSPVILGRSLVGAVDYVGEKQSRVRLVTDATLKPAVRAVRGSAQNMLLVEHIDPILRSLAHRKDLTLNSNEKNALIKLLQKWKSSLSCHTEGFYLAKGIIQGGGTPLWRSVNQSVRGIGFNYDFPDDEGPARELATGKPIGGESSDVSIPIIKLNDLLVTSGMDGVFPPGLRVAEVTHIHPLREGGYTYEIEASLVVGNLDTLHTVFIIPPIGYEEES